MATETEQPRKHLIIKLCFPRSEATKKVDYSAKPIIKSYWASRGGNIIKKKKSDHHHHHHRETENTRSKKVVVDAINVSRTVSSASVVQLKNDVVGFRGEIKKTMKAMSSTARNPENYSRRRVGAKDHSSRTVDSSSSSVDDYSRPKKMMKVERPRSNGTRTTTVSNNFIKENKTTSSMKGAAVSVLSKTLNRKNDDVESKKEKKKKKEIVMEMDRCKKMQCWAILKRMMIGKDGWALKQFSIDYLKKPLEEINVNNNNSDQCGNEGTTLLSKSITTKSMKPTKKLGLEDIEGKLNKWLYSKPDEFADDIRLVFSRALMLYPPRTEIHRIATRLSDTFETSWKSLKEKWKLEARQQHIYN